MPLRLLWQPRVATPLAPVVDFILEIRGDTRRWAIGKVERRWHVLDTTRRWQDISALARWVVMELKRTVWRF